jgi:hypothetical protein
MKNEIMVRLAVIICLFAVVVLAATCLYIVVSNDFEKDSPESLGLKQQYQAWVNLHHRQDLTFEEWNALRAGRFLDDYRCSCGQLEKP